MPDNPALWADLKAMGFDPPVKLSKGRHPSLSYKEMPAFMSVLRERDAIAARALEFLILTNVRTDAVLKATFDQIDLDKAVWTVPLENLKDRIHREEAFRVPLRREPSRSFARCGLHGLPVWSFLGKCQAILEHGVPDAHQTNEFGHRPEVA